MHNLHPAVKAIIQQDNKYLILKQEFPHNFIWDIPGGKVDYGESPYDTLKREVLEEVHLSVNIVKPLGFFWFFRQDYDQVICTTFLCTADNYNVDITKNPVDENITEYKWVTKEEFLSDEYVVGHKSLKEIFKQL